MKKTYYSENLNDTEKLAEQIAEWATEQKLNKQASVIALEGELGSGKTTFVQSLGKKLGIEKKILSPTFVILKKFKLNKTFDKFYHIDCYRIETPEELLKLDFKEIVNDPDNIVIIEWADKVKSILPDNYLKLKFKVQGKNEREVEISNKQQ